MNVSLQGIVTVLFLFIFFVTAQSSRAQSDSKDSIDKCDSLERKSFFELAKKLQKETAVHKDLSDSESYTLVKLYNTITTNEQVRKDRLNVNNFLKEIEITFDKYYYWLFKNKYELQYSKGGNLYLKTLDIWIGLPNTWRCKDFFWVY